MRKPLKIAVSVLLISIAAFVCLRWVYGRNQEPVYQGRPLTMWLHDYLGWDTSPGEWAQAKDRADYAVRQIGTNAIPTLLELVSETNSASMSKWVDLWDRHIERMSFLPVRVRHPDWYKNMARYHNMEGEVGFKILGADACGAVPNLMSIYEKSIAMDSIAAMDCQAAVSRSLIDIGASAIPSVMRWAASSNETQRIDAVYVLSHIKAQPSVVIPVLVASLSHTNFEVRLLAVEGMGRFGTEAQSAIPALVKVLGDSNGQVRRAATNALKAVDAEAARAGRAF